MNKLVPVEADVAALTEAEIDHWELVLEHQSLKKLCALARDGLRLRRMIAQNLGGSMRALPEGDK